MGAACGPTLITNRHPTRLGLTFKNEIMRSQNYMNRISHCINSLICEKIFNSFDIKHSMCGCVGVDRSYSFNKSSSQDYISYNQWHKKLFR